MSTISYRKLDLNGDPLMGQGQANFLADGAAVAQAIQTRLNLLVGEWWENLNAGTPVFQSMLGVSGAGKNPQAVALLLTQRILGTPYVTGVSEVATSYDPNARSFAYSCQVATQFGSFAISSAPAFVATLAPLTSFIATGIPSAEAFGALTLMTGTTGVTQTLTAIGIPSLEKFGNPSLNLATANFLATGIPSAEAFGNPTLAAGSAPVTAANQIYNDMTGTHEGEPDGLPSSYNFYAGPLIDIGNNVQANGVGAVVLWTGAYGGPSGNPSTNTLINIRKAQLCWLRNSTKVWTNVTLSYSDFSGDQYSGDFVTDYSTLPPNWRQESDGSWSYGVINGRVSHCYAPYPRIPIDNTDFAGLVSLVEATLILLNPAGTDDRASASILLDCGADPYVSATGAGIQNNPSIGIGKFKYVTTSLRSFAMTSCSLATLQAYPPPINLAGVNP